MQIIQQILFTLLTVGAIWLFFSNVKNIRSNILLGRDTDLSDNPQQRWRNVLFLALGQQKMFKYPLVAALHLCLYAGFIIINIEILEIILDGIFGTHRLFAPTLGSVYTFLINAFEVLAFLVLAACVVFLSRRNILKVKRLDKPELNGFPKKDANIILFVEIVLMSLFLLMNGVDQALQAQPGSTYHHTGNFFISGLLVPAFEGMNATTLVAIERVAWWLHIIGVLAFLNYLPYSKHLHIILGFPNSYYGSLLPEGKLINMREIQNEVLYAMQPEMAPTNE